MTKIARLSCLKAHGDNTGLTELLGRSALLAGAGFLLLHLRDGTSRALYREEDPLTAGVEYSKDAADVGGGEGVGALPDRGNETRGGDVEIAIDA